MYSFLLIRGEVIRAFKAWSDISALELTETSGRADIEISFEEGDHSDGSSFDGQGIYY